MTCNRCKKKVPIKDDFVIVVFKLYSYADKFKMDEHDLCIECFNEINRKMIALIKGRGE